MDTPSENHPEYAEWIREKAIEISGLDPAPDFSNDNVTAIEEDLGFDSLDVLELVMAIEDHWHIDIKQGELPTLDIGCSINAIVALVERKLEEKN